MARRKIKIGLVDADLLCNGTRHPNLALLKIAGYFRDNGYVRGYTDGASCYELITNESNFEELQKYDYFYVSCVFTFTIDEPPLVLTTLLNDKKLSKRVRMGGTGTYANLSVEEGFAEKREEDMQRLEKDAFLNTLKNKSGGYGIDMRTQMPDYHLYDEREGIGCVLQGLQGLLYWFLDARLFPSLSVLREQVGTQGHAVLQAQRFP